MDKKHKTKNIKAAGVNLEPASTESNEVNLPAAGSVVKFKESDIPKEKNFEDALREFVFKYCHFFITESDSFVFRNLIGKFEVCKFHHEIKFEDLKIKLAESDYALFLEQRVVKQKEYFKNPIIFKP